MTELPSRLVVIADGFTHPARLGTVQQLLAEAPPFWLHLRDHESDTDAFLASARKITRWNDARTVPCAISINRKIDVAERLGLNFHTGRNGPDVAAARARLQPGALVGYSAHKQIEAGVPADYFFFSPIFETGSKAGVGLEALAVFVQMAAPAPVLALGGVTPADAGACIDSGARGVAAISAVMDARDPAAAASAFVRSVSKRSGQPSPENR